MITETIPGTTMTKAAAIKTAQRIAAEGASISFHQGETRKDRAVRVSGCWPEQGREIGAQIAEAIGGTLRVSAGSVLVWF